MLMIKKINFHLIVINIILLFNIFTIIFLSKLQVYSKDINIKLQDY